MNPDGVDLLVFVEDPGAANYVAPLMPFLERRGYRLQLLVAGLAAEHLAARGVRGTPLNLGEPVEGILERVRPRVLVAGTSENVNSAGLALIAAARDRGITTVGVVDGPANGGYRFRGASDRPLAFSPDWMLVPDEHTRTAYLDLGFSPDRILACGHPHYDDVRERGRRFEAEGRPAFRTRLFPEAQDRQLVVFAAEISGGLNPEQYRRSPEYTLEGRGSDTRTEVVLDELIDAVSTIAPRPYLVLRLHLKNVETDFPRHIGAFDRISRVEAALEVVFAADVVIGMTSMLLVEAALLGRPTLSIVPRAAERDWLPSIAWGVSPCVQERAAIAPELRRALQRREGDPVTAAMVPDGCTDRVVAFLETLLPGR